MTVQKIVGKHLNDLFANLELYLESADETKIFQISELRVIGAKYEIWVFLLEA